MILLLIKNRSKTVQKLLTQQPLQINVLKSQATQQDSAHSTKLMYLKRIKESGCVFESKYTPSLHTCVLKYHLKPK